MRTLVLSCTALVSAFPVRGGNLPGGSSALAKVKNSPSSTSCAAAAVSGGATRVSASEAMGAGNAALFDAEAMGLLETLAGLDQGHLFEDWPAAGTEDEGKKRLVEALARTDAAYEGGLETYILKSRELLEAASRGDNPFEGFAPSVPDGEILTWGEPEFAAMEAEGLKAASRTGFVLVAGGLGERLGYEGIKLELPVDLASGKSFIELYVDYVAAVQRRSRAASGDPSLVVPLCIMTSDDTDGPTRALLAANDDFGAEPGQITIMKQDKVAALSDGNARLALDGDDRWSLLTKPHGHGDVHALMRTTGVAKKWRDEFGLKYVFFFQDTNPLVLNTILPALGVSARRHFAMNSVCVPRRAGEAQGHKRVRTSQPLEGSPYLSALSCPYSVPEAHLVGTEVIISPQGLVR